MSERVGLSQGEWRTLKMFAILVFSLWLILATLPFGFAILSLWLPKGWDGQLGVILQRFGTFGDMFGCMNVLLAGGALIGLGYTGILQREQVRLQRKELDRLGDEADKAKKEREITSQNEHRLSLINANSYLAQTYAAIYQADPLTARQEYSSFMSVVRSVHTSPERKEEVLRQANACDYGRLLHYTKALESLLADIDGTSEFVAS